LAGFIGNSATSRDALLGYGRASNREGEGLDAPVELTDELAWAVRKLAGSDYGLSLHGIADPKSEEQNLARGQTYIALTDGDRFWRAASGTAGRGAYDRARMTLSALDLLRTALIEGTP